MTHCGNVRTRQFMLTTTTPFNEAAVTSLRKHVHAGGRSADIHTFNEAAVTSLRKLRPPNQPRINHFREWLREATAKSLRMSVTGSGGMTQVLLLV